jgi:small subunit ribosomal protein S17|tara:strand:- start:329 stop:670 length:342 start_codon:yes stop_codon:yes gene_type:complete
MSDKKPRNIGVDVEVPVNPWDGDPNDPFFGSLSVRGQILRGKVVKAKAQRTVVVQINKMKYDSKYERYARSSSKISAHSPASVGASEGDLVTLMECRPLSKTKSFVVIERRDG